MQVLADGCIVQGDRERGTQQLSRYVDLMCNTNLVQQLFFIYHCYCRWSATGSTGNVGMLIVADCSLVFGCVIKSPEIELYQMCMHMCAYACIVGSKWCEPCGVNHSFRISVTVTRRSVLVVNLFEKVLFVSSPFVTNSEEWCCLQMPMCASHPKTEA